MDFTQEFESELRRLYTELELKDYGRAGGFIDTVQGARDKLEANPSLGEIFSLTSEGVPLFELRVLNAWRLIYSRGDAAALIWIEEID